MVPSCNTVHVAVSFDAWTSSFTFGKSVTGTETFNIDCEAAVSGDASCLVMVMLEVYFSIAVSGKDAEGGPAAVNSVCTLYSSAVGVIGVGKLSRTNLSTILASTCLMFDEACTTSADFKWAEPIVHEGTLYSTMLTTI